MSLTAGLIKCELVVEIDRCLPLDERVGADVISHREQCRAAEATGSGRRRHTADLGARHQSVLPFRADMGGKPGSISVQMAPGDKTVGRIPMRLDRSGHHDS